MPAYEVIEGTVTEGGYAKVEYKGIGTEGYRDLEADEPVAQQAHAASKGQEDRVVVKRRSDGQIVARRDKSEVLTVDGEPKGLTDGERFGIEVEDSAEARDLLERHGDQWGAFQLVGVWRAVISGGSGTSTEIVSGASKVHDSIEPVSFPVPRTVEDPETGEPETVWEEIEADTVALAYRQAEDHAWSKVHGSILSWTRQKLSVVFYANEGTDWAEQATELTHVEVDA